MTVEYWNKAARTVYASGGLNPYQSASEDPRLAAPQRIDLRTESVNFLDDPSSDAGESAGAVVTHAPALAEDSAASPVADPGEHFAGVPVTGDSSRGGIDRGEDTPRDLRLSRQLADDLRELRDAHQRLTSEVRTLRRDVGRIAGILADSPSLTGTGHQESSFQAAESEAATSDIPATTLTGATDIDLSDVSESAGAHPQSAPALGHLTRRALRHAATQGGEQS